MLIMYHSQCQHLISKLIAPPNPIILKLLTTNHCIVKWCYKAGWFQAYTDSVYLTEICLFMLRNGQTQNLLKQIEMMKAAVAGEEEKAYELEIKSKSVDLNPNYPYKTL